MEIPLKKLFVLLFALIPCNSVAQDAVATAPRAEITLNGNWQYVLNQAQSSIPTSGWSTTRVPALPLTDGTTSVWYQQSVYVPASWNRSGRRFFVSLGKAGHYAAVYCNGTFIYDHFGQFSPFEVEVTGYLIFGQNNLIQVYVHKADTTYVRRGANIDQSMCPPDNPDCIGNAYRAYSGPTVLQRNWVGLVGDVTLSWRPGTYVSDAFVITSVRNATIQTSVSVVGTGADTAVSEVLDGANVVLSLPSQPIVAGSATLEASWTNPVLWGPVPYGQPKLYNLRTRLLLGGTLVDTFYTRFGFREVWVEGTTVYLNGQRLWIAGDQVHFLTPQVYANDRRPQALLFDIAEQSGFNTMQVHWDDVGESWYDLADEMGILVPGSFYCNGPIADQSQVDTVTDWTNWIVATATEWATARRNHPSIVMFRPVDRLPQSVSQASVFPQVAAAVLSVDSTRPFFNGPESEAPNEIDTWSQSVQNTQNPTECDDGSAFAAKLASETIPLLAKELNGDFSLPCVPSFWNTFYQEAYTGNGLGLNVHLDIFQNQAFTPSWFSISGIGNRPAASTDLPNWATRVWTPSNWSTQFAGLFETYFQPALPNTSPTSGDYEASGLTTALPQSVAFLLPSKDIKDIGDPTGVLIAQDGSGTAWFVTPGTGAYQLLYTNGSADVIQNVTVQAPTPF